MGSPVWAKVEETNGSGRAGNGSGVGGHNFLYATLQFLPQSYSLWTLYCSQRIWGKSGSWLVYLFCCSCRLVCGSNISKRLLLITPDACGLGQGGPNWPFGGTIPGIASINPAGPHLLMRPGHSCGPCLDKGPRDKAGGRQPGGKRLWQLLWGPGGSRG